MNISLKEQIEKLQNPAPLLDPEEEYWNDSSSAKLCHQSSAQGDDAMDQSWKGHTRTLKPKVSTRVAYLDQMDKKYQGNTISRSQIQRQAEEQDDDSDDGSDVGSSMDDQSHSNQSLNHSDYDSDDIDLQNEQNNDDNSSDSDDDIEDSDQNLSESEEHQTRQSDEEDEVDDSEEEVDEIQNFAQGNAAQEIEKGQATKAQLQLWDYFMDWRIQMQSILQLANHLPQHHVYSDFIQCGGETYVQALHKCKSSIASLLSNLLELQQQLMTQYPEIQQLLTNSNNKGADTGSSVVDDDDEIPSDDETVHGIKSTATKDTEDDASDDGASDDNDQGIDSGETINDKNRKGKKRRFQGNYYETMVKRSAVINKFKDASIQKWNDRTQIAFGKLNSKKFTNFDQSILQQIQKILTDKERLVKRTQLKRLAVRPLGNPDAKDTQDNQVHDSHLKDYDPEIFDDSDFYHQLLRELIESKSTFSKDSDPLAMGRQWLQFQQLRSKIKRKVDTKASKGRKLRYDTHDKLISFTAPIRRGTWSDSARNNLCASLFGKKGTKYKAANDTFDEDIVMFG